MSPSATGNPYEVNIKIDSSWVSTFNDNGVRLIMAKVFKDPSGQDYFNVVASADDVTENMTASWKDVYQICGSTETFHSGQIISGISGQLDIDFKQTYKLEEWSKYFVVDDSGLPPTSFGFQNDVTASAVVQLNINGTFTPVYMSPYKFPPGKATLTPKSKVVFWFQADLESSTMITMDISNSYTVDLTHATTATLTYDKKGKWQQVDNTKEIEAGGKTY